MRKKLSWNKASRDIQGKSLFAVGGAETQGRLCAFAAIDRDLFITHFDEPIFEMAHRALPSFCCRLHQDNY
ncbi:MAG TPA: hypothetical protein VJS30_09990 [Paraburkholderia sp.]|nr:hypothetical protein [Paraburkholderia sp.]